MHRLRGEQGGGDGETEGEDRKEAEACWDRCLKQRQAPRSPPAAQESGLAPASTEERGIRSRAGVQD